MHCFAVIAILYPLRWHLCFGIKWETTRMSRSLHWWSCKHGRRRHCQGDFQCLWACWTDKPKQCPSKYTSKTLPILKRFLKLDSVERAVKFSGHLLVIGDGRDRKTKIGRICFDYDKLPGGSEEVQSGMVVKEKAQLPQEKQEQDLSFEFTRKQAFHLLDLIRHDQALRESLGTDTLVWKGRV